MGYDISDYRGVAPEYGSLKDFQSFRGGASPARMRLIWTWFFNILRTGIRGSLSRAQAAPPQTGLVCVEAGTE